MNDFERQVLVQLYLQSRDTLKPSLSSLAASLNVNSPRILAALTKLERLGCVDAARVRLTMSGLMLAHQQQQKAMKLRDSCRMAA